MVSREAMLGRPLFEVFPDNPDDPGATGEANLGASLARVLAFKRPDSMAIQKYDIRRPAEEGGGFEVRHWSPINTPVIDANGEVAWIIHRVEDVTRLVELAAEDETRRQLVEEQSTTIAQLRRSNEELAQTQLALTVTEERFRSLANKLPGVVYRRIMYAGGTKFRDVYVSDGVREYLGIDPELIMSGDKTLLDFIHPDDHGRKVGALLSTARSLEPMVLEVRKLKQPSGGIRWWQIHATPTLLPNGDVQFDSIALDITDRKATEVQLQHAMKLDAMGQLTGGVAHDFNNLLTVILGNAEALVEELNDNHRLRMLAEITQTAAERGAELTNRLLAFARKQALEPKVLDVNKLISGMDAMVRRTLGENMEIELIRGAGLWSAVADPSQLESAVLNLAINARDAMRSGGKLTVETANAHIDETYSARHNEVTPGQYVLISMTDTGTGMTPEVAARAFDPFFSTKEVGKGTGLGLSMVYGFVKQSGGHIKIYSETGQGTTIRIYLPRAFEAARENEVEAPGGEPGGRERILLVEDDPLVRQHAEAMLRSLGYTVLAAKSGPEALPILAGAEALDLLFTDVVMPGGMSGRELADRAHSLRPGLKVLFTSGYTENAIVHQGRLDPGVQLLRKPYRRRDLALKLRSVLGG
jgi:PAS domain S-box-containing protein